MVKLKETDKMQAKAEADAKKAAEGKALAPVEKAKPIKTNATLEDLEVVYFPLVTEKAVNMIEAENKITFIVSDKAGKEEIRKVIESAYGVKVAKVNIVRDRKGKKKAVVKLKPEYKAEELATKLGVL